jgi:hypothetical protein
MAIENVWLTTVELGMGIQFVSTPMEFPDAWAGIKSLLRVPDDLELMPSRSAICRPVGRPHRPTIFAPAFVGYVFRDVCTRPNPRGPT